MEKWPVSVSASRSHDATGAIERTGPGIHVAVWVAMGLTFVAVAVIGQFRQTEVGTALEHRLFDRSESNTHVDVAASYLDEARGLDDEALATLARTYAAKHPPSVVDKAGLRLTRDRQRVEDGRAGVFLLEAGARLYRSSQLLERVGWQFYQGYYVKRDFEKATYFLSDPRVRYRVTSIYRLGRVLFDRRNPQGDEARGLALIRAAADRGHPGAISWLMRREQAEQ